MEFTHKVEEINKDEIKLYSSKYETSVILKKSMCLWIINTLRNATLEDYYTEGKKWRTTEFGDDLKSLSIKTDFFVRSTPYSNLEVFPNWKDDNKCSSVVVIPYIKGVPEILMSEFIEPVLHDLEKYVPECDKSKIAKPWSINLSIEEYEKKRNSGKNSDNQMNLKFAGEISPDELFK